MSPEQLAQKKRINTGEKNRTYEPKDVGSQKKAIAIIGLGYVGLPLSILAASKGRHVIGFDIDEVKVAQLERREATFLSEDEADQFVEAKSLTVTSDETQLKHAGVFIICVPTPVRADHMPDLRPLESAARIVGKYLSKGSLVVIESTVNPGACEEVVLPILEKVSGLERSEFFFSHCPERINPGDERWSVRSIPRVVGGLNDESLRQTSMLYESLVDADVVAMGSIKEAEAVKMVENSFRDINIAFVNELAMAFDKAGIDITNVIRGASTKPFGFMAHYPGAGVGGHCIPVDPYYLIRYGHNNGFEHRFLLTARSINNSMPLYTVRVLKDALDKHGKSLKGSTVALLGLAYKRDVPDMRESPALKIRELLEKRGAKVRSFDPHLFSESSARSLEEALSGASAVVIATDHAPFRTITPKTLEHFGIKVIIDGRNCLDKKAFQKSSVTYRGIGRR